MFKPKVSNYETEIKKQKEEILYNIKYCNYHEIPAGLDCLEKLALSEGRRDLLRKLTRISR